MLMKNTKKPSDSKPKGVDKTKDTTGKLKKPANIFKVSNAHMRLASMLITAVIFAIILYPTDFKPTIKYSIGDVVQRDIKATADFFVEDKEATQANRTIVVEHVKTVYDHDDRLTGETTRRVTRAFAKMRPIFTSLKQPAKSINKTEKNSKSPQASNNDSTAISEPVPGTPSGSKPAEDSKTAAKTDSEEAISNDKPTTPTPIDTAPPFDLAWLQKDQFEATIGINVSKGAYNVLIENGFSEEIQKLINKIVTLIFKNGIVENKEILLNENDKGIIIRTISTKKELEIYNLKRYYGLDQAKTMVRVTGQPFLKGVDYTKLNLIVDFSQRLLKPNITSNISETEDRKQLAIDQVKPIMYKIKAGEMLIREGELVTRMQIKKLEQLQAQTEETQQRFISHAGSAFLILSVLITAFVLYHSRVEKASTNSDKNILFMTSMLFVFLLIAKIFCMLFDPSLTSTPFPTPTAPFGIPMAAAAMTVCLFLGIQTTIPFALVIAACTAVIFGNSFQTFIYFLISSSMGAYWMISARERKVFIIAGLKLGLLNALLAIIIDLQMESVGGLSLPWHAGIAFLGGIVCSIVTTGITPLVEVIFGYSTDIKLMELANLDRPILKRLMLESPGTYHHSVLVGTLVEAAASEIGANPILAKVCGYYHDIGKINKPLYFIENQAGGKNRHDKLAPSMSSLILIAHIKDGVEIATQNKLGPEIIDAIRQHHGTSLIKFFFEKAKQLKGEDAVNIRDFRYPGPKPQTKEFGLVMLADIVEAASRTLDDPTPARIQGLVQNLINQVFSDGQLDSCELTLKDLHNIAKSFTKILNGIHHHRIEYPEKSSTTNGKTDVKGKDLRSKDGKSKDGKGKDGKVKDGKEKNGNPDRQQTDKTQNSGSDNKKKDSGHLKRLGL